MMDTITLSADALLRLAFTEAEHREMSARHTLIQETGGYQPSEDFERRIQLLVKSEKRKAHFRQFQKVLKRAAVFMALCLTLVSCVFMPVQAVQQAVISTVIEWRDKFAKLIYSTDSDTAFVLPTTIRVEYWPKGYTEKENESIYNDNMFVLQYANAKGQLSSVYIHAIEEEQWAAIDNENSEIFELVIDDKNVVCSINRDGTIMLRWVEGQMLFEVVTPENLQEAVAIARSIKY